jgi:hypothetical protein
MARYKTQNDGSIYYDPNDDGPDQATKEQIDAYNAAQKPSPLVDYATGKMNESGVNYDAQIHDTNAPAQSTAQQWMAQPSQPFQREQFRDQWMGTGTDVNAQNNLLSQYGLKADSAGRVTLPTGETLDLRIGAKSGQNLAGWTGVAGGGAKYGQAPDTGVGAASAAPGLTTASGTAAGTPGSAILEYLLQKAMSKPAVDRNNVIVRAQSDAYGANTDKARRDFIGDAAERLGPYASGALLGQERMSAEAAGKANATFEAQAMQQELTAQRNEIMQALNGALGILSQDKQLALTEKLAQIDNALAYARLNQDQNQFNASDAFRRLELGQRSYEFDANDEFRRSPLAS